MNFTDIFIRRPVFASVLSLMLLLVGAISFFKLPLRLFPEIDSTVITITTNYPGASPSLMEGFVTTPIEGAIASVEGLDYVTSTNTQGTSEIDANFVLGYDMNAAVADIVNAVSSVRWSLPQDINDPIIQKLDPNSTPILFVSFTDPNLTRVQINDYMVRTVQPVLQTLNGVGEAMIFGNLTYAMRIWLNPNEMAARGVTTQDIQNALSSNNLQAATGRIKNTWQEFNTTLASDVTTSKEFNNLVIKQDSNSLVRVADIGHAVLGTPEQRASAEVNGAQTNVMGIIPRADANSLDVANLVKTQLTKLASEFPKGLKATVVWDNSLFISASIKELSRTILEAVIFVVLVIFLFLGSARAVIIPFVTIPLSLIGVCGPMLAMGYSLNMLTFLAFVLAIGMVVDDAIVVSENVHRQIERGNSRLTAALVGTREIRFAVIAMSLTLSAVYAPIMFMTGLTGALFKEFAFALAIAVLISGFVALTLSPMLCSKILPEKGHSGRFEHWVNHVTDLLAKAYKKALTLVLKVRIVILGVIIVIFGLCYYLYNSIPSELAPKEDMGGLLTVVTAPAAANLQYTQKYTDEIYKIYQEVPEGVFTVIVNGIPNGVNSAIAFLTLKPWDERTRSVDEVIGWLMPRLLSIPGVLAFPVNPFRLPGSTQLMPISFVVKSTGSYEELYQVAQQIKAAAAQDPTIANLDMDLKIDKPQIDININRDLAGELGLKMSDIGNAINLAVGEPLFNQFEFNGRGYYVIPQLEKQFREQPQALDNLNLRTTSGQLVPLSSIIDVQESVVPQSLNHFQQLRAVTFTASPAPGYTLGQALAAFKTISQKYIKGDMQIDYADQSRQFIETSGSMLQTFIFAVLFIFLVLSAQFESFRDPLIVMFSVPLSTAGALLFLKFGGGTLNIYTQIGLLTLVGLISKHGILMVEFANQLQHRGHEKREAIIEAASIRLRPILMTTAAMVLGALPLALASGAGAESRHQIGMVIIGGMLFGTTFTLFVVPTVYTWLATKKAPSKELEPLTS